jgi:hypothetical protein
VLAFAAAVLVVAGVALWAEAGWWRPTAMVGLAVSMVLVVVYFNLSYVFIFAVNVALIVGSPGWTGRRHRPWALEPWRGGSQVTPVGGPAWTPRAGRSPSGGRGGWKGGDSGAYQDVVSEQEMIAGTQRARAEESALWHSSFSDGTAAMRTRARRMSYLRMSYL